MTFLVAHWRVIALALLAGALFLAGAGYGRSRAEARFAIERAAWANERTKAAERAAAALASEIAAHNRTANELEALHDSAVAERAIAERQIAAADAAASAAVRSASRLRDSLATASLATRAALASAGATGLCTPATDAIRVRDGLLDEYRASAQRLGDLGLASATFARRQTGAASECAGWADAVSRTGP